jgi:hypothetical protein
MESTSGLPEDSAAGGLISCVLTGLVQGPTR